MSNEIPKHLHDLIEKLREQGVNVSVASITTGEVRTADEPNPLHKVMSQALKVMGEHNFDGHRRCMTMNAMQVVGFLVTEGDSLVGTINHLNRVHELPEAAEWEAATLKLLTALDGTIRASERDTGNGFQFVSDEPGVDEKMAANIRKAEERVAELKAAKAAPVH